MVELQEEKFNRSLSVTRSTIERAFVLLKGRFRRLKYLDMTNVTKIPEVIIACRVLHNICFKNKDNFTELEKETPEEISEMYHTNFTQQKDKQAGRDKRNMIADAL